MKLRGVLCAGAFVLACLLASGRAEAAVSLVLEITGMPGESVVPGFTGQIDVFSVSMGVSSPSCGGSLSLSDLNLMKRTDKASIPLSTALRDHTVIPTVTLRFVRSDGQVNAKYILTNAVVTSWQASASGGGDDFASESLSFTYSQVATSYTFFDAAGKPGATQTVTLTSPSCP